MSATAATHHEGSVPTTLKGTEGTKLNIPSLNRTAGF